MGEIGAFRLTNGFTRFFLAANQGCQMVHIFSNQKS
jgi:hypothetical protein